jgi:tetratricopeptide (TPR) repeat protein
MKYDFNRLERAALSLAKQKRFNDALKIYYFMADGDPSLDGGYLGKRIAECYEALGEFHAAKYWYGRAIEENRIVRADCVKARANLESLSIESLVDDESEGSA